MSRPRAKLRSGFVTVLGRPNVGKSTLVNALVGEKVSIVTAKPQTTRDRILGISEVPALRGRHAAAQIVWMDTPGVHQGSSELDRRMLQQVQEALLSRDLVLMVVDATRAPAAGAAAEESEDGMLLRLLAGVDCPVILVINKIDLLERKRLLPMIAALSAQREFAAVVPVSARTGDGLDRLLDAVIALLPEGRRYFPAEQFTDQPERFLAAELIRERILVETGEEVPYASAVLIERWEEPPPAQRPAAGEGRPLPLTRIAAAIYCERAGQKAILIGRGGEKLKAIGAGARRRIEALLGTRVYLELHVVVEEKWRDRKGFLDQLDWRRQLEAGQNNEDR